MEWSRRSVHRAHLDREKEKEVTQQRLTLPPHEKTGWSGNATGFIVPASRENWMKRSSKAVHCAQLGRKKEKEVTQQRLTLPPHEKTGWSGNAAGFIVPSSEGKRRRRRRGGVHRARRTRKWDEEVQKKNP